MADFPVACDDAVGAAKDLNLCVFANVETSEHVLLAADAAKALVASGAVGVGLVSAILSGHANPGHAPRPGWSHDYINVTVQCAEPYPPAGVGA